MIRILTYDTHGCGYWLMTKRLSAGRYSGWPRDGHSVGALEAVALRKLLAGALA